MTAGTTASSRRKSLRQRSSRRGRTRRPAIRAANALERDAPTPSRPPELDWIAGLRLHWLGVTPVRRRRALGQLRSAAGRRTVENCLGGIQKSLRLLDVNPAHAAQIIIALFRGMGGREPAQAAKRIAKEVLKMLESF